MILTDTHVHLNSDQLYTEVEAFINAAKAVHVERFFVIGYDYDSSLRAIEIADRFPNVYAVIGVHPTEVEKSRAIDELIQHSKVVGIGEVGLDYYWDSVPRERQKTEFARQIKLAFDHQLPIVIHMRDATQDTLDVLRANKQFLTKGIMHCYSGSVENVHDFIELGFYISLGGPVTFVNAKTPKDVARIVPSERLLIETDSPYLAPHPFRGKQNSPALLPLIAKEIAMIRLQSVESIAELTTQNSKDLFGV